MSRSRKQPIIGHTCKESEKKDKINSHKRFRRLNKMLLKADKNLLFSLKEISNVWNFAKDGKVDIRHCRIYTKYYTREELIELASRK